jgi:hypothetical protein
MKLLGYHRELNNMLEKGMKLESYNPPEYMRDIHERHEYSKVGWSEQCEATVEATVEEDTVDSYTSLIIGNFVISDDKLIE